MNANSQIAKGGACKVNDNKDKFKVVIFLNSLTQQMKSVSTWNKVERTILGMDMKIKGHAICVILVF